MEALIKRLRNRKSLRLYDKNKGWEVRLHLNKTTKRICWERWVKCIGATHSDRWVQHNAFLTLRECANVIRELKTN